MTKTCNGLCRDGIKKAQYIDGYKRCKVCEKFFLTENFRCKCCGELLKSKPSASIRKKKFYENQKIIKLEALKESTSK